jgi:alkyl sulfatase BDS1-like metallo-beta-lactamase superfamily hydrolase
MPNPDLVAYTDDQLRKDVVRLAPGIYSAIGFAASNVHMVEGADTLTIIDTTESTRAAENILAEFQELTGKPVGRIIYTHSHRDHISGATVFSDGSVPIYASHLFSSDLVGVDADRIAPDAALGARTRAQFGIGLSPDERISLGCGPGNRPMEGLGAGFLAPMVLINEDCSLDLDGVEARLILAGGETADHMVVWLPKEKILFCGDNWYHAFPNLYAIRGTPYRDFETWADSLDRLSHLNADILAPGHTRPVFGADAVRDVLETTRDAILHVMRFTADGMNAGRSLDDIAASISLPPEIADRPWLKEYYGKLGWSARAYAGGTLGWYDGNPTHLEAMPTRQRARHMCDLAGGEAAMLQAARSSDDRRWTLELCDHLIALGRPEATGLKAATLRQLGEAEINATARNSYLSEAKRLEALIEAS